jgi:hypothetical protein
MVVILRDAALVFWMEYRRYVRTRRYWVLALTTLALGMLLCLIAALVAARIPPSAAAFSGRVGIPARDDCRLVRGDSFCGSQSPLGTHAARCVQNALAERPVLDGVASAGGGAGARSGDDPRLRG